MGNFRPWTGTSKRTIIDYDNFVDRSEKDFVVCINGGALAILRKLAVERGFWPTSYAVSRSDRGYIIPSGAELDLIDRVLSDFLADTNEVEMCNDALIDALNAIAAGSQGGCNCGSGGGPAVSPPVDTTDTGDITSGTGTPPTGYADWAEYQAKKCDIATWIVGNLQDDIAWLGTLSLVSLTVAALGAGIAGFLSANVVLLILAAALAILAYDYTILDDGSDAIADGFEDLVCALLTGETATESISQFSTEVDAQVDAATADPTARFLLKPLLKYWADSTAVNLMYEPAATVAGKQIPVGADCVGCGVGCSAVHVTAGTDLGNDNFRSADNAGLHYVIFNVRDNDSELDCSGVCGSEQEIQIDTLLGWSDAVAGFNNFRLYDDTDCTFTSSNATVYNSDSIPSPTTWYCVRRVAIVSATEFDVHINFGTDC